MIASIFSGLLNSALSGISGSFAQAANSFLGVLFQLLNSSTSLSLQGSSFLTEFNAVFMIGILVALALAMIELGAAALQRNGARVARVPLNLVAMILGTAVSISLIDVLLTISDQLSAGLLQATGFSLSTTGMTSALAVVAAQPGTELMLAIFIIIAVVSCYFALVVRRVLIVVAAVMAPLALAGATASATRSWVRRWSETMLALIFSKVILVIVLVTGFHLLQGAGATNVASGIASLIGGVGLLFIAAFSPLMAMKMVTFTGGHFAEAALLGHQAVSAAAAPMKRAAHLGTTAATGGLSGVAGAVVGGRLATVSRPPTSGGVAQSSRGPGTPGAPSTQRTSRPQESSTVATAPRVPTTVTPTTASSLDPRAPGERTPSSTPIVAGANRTERGGAVPEKVTATPREASSPIAVARSATSHNGALPSSGSGAANDSAPGSRPTVPLSTISTSSAERVSTSPERELDGRVSRGPSDAGGAEVPGAAIGAPATPTSAAPGTRGEDSDSPASAFAPGGPMVADAESPSSVPTTPLTPSQPTQPSLNAVPSAPFSAPAATAANMERPAAPRPTAERPVPPVARQRPSAPSNAAAVTPPAPPEPR